MGTVGKVTELSLPEDKSVRVSRGVALLETKDGVLRQVTVRSNECARRVVLGNAVDGHVVSVSVLEEDVSVSVRESTSFDILARETNMVTFVNQSSEGESLGSSPVDTFARGNGLLTSLEDLDDLRVELAIGRQLSDLLSDRLQAIDVNTSVFDVAIFLRVLDILPIGVEPVFSFEFKVLALLISFFKLIISAFLNFLQGVLRNALGDELLAVNIADWGHVLDDGVH